MNVTVWLDAIAGKTRVDVANPAIERIVRQAVAEAFRNGMTTAKRRVAADKIFRALTSLGWRAGATLELEVRERFVEERPGPVCQGCGEKRAGQDDERCPRPTEMSRRGQGGCGRYRHDWGTLGEPVERSLLVGEVLPKSSSCRWAS